jgi:serine/threonine-protein kinase
MTNWDPQANDVFLKALERAPDEREEFLNEACAGDSALRAEVESLLEASGRVGSFLESPLDPRATPPVANSPSRCARGPVR